MENGARISQEELERIQLWRQDLIDSLGCDLRVVVEACHRTNVDVGCLLRLSYLMEGKSLRMMGIRLLYEKLTAERAAAGTEREDNIKQEEVG